MPAFVRPYAIKPSTSRARGVSWSSVSSPAGGTRSCFTTSGSSAALSAVATVAVGVLLGAGGVSIRYRRGLTLR